MPKRSETRGERIGRSLRNPDEDSKRSLILLIFLVVNSLKDAIYSIEHVKEKIIELREKLIEATEGKQFFYFYFGDTHDPHNPSAISLDKILDNLIDQGYLLTNPCYSEGVLETELLRISDKGRGYLLDNLKFMAEFLEKKLGHKEGFSFLRQYL